MQGYESVHLCLSEACSRQLAAGPCYSLILVIRGTAHFRWESERWACATEDIMLVKPGASVWLDHSGGKTPLEVQWVRITPQLLVQISTPAEDVYGAFASLPGTRLSAHSTSEIAMLTKSLALRLADLPEAEEEFGRELFEESILKMFAVLVLRAFIRSQSHRIKGSRKHLMMDELFIFIRQHISEEITLERLEKEFYISRCHIAREFKRQTGQTVHQYIIKAKLDLCCSYIEQGMPITEVYRLAGFGSYNHFFRVFRQYYGMTPKEYFRSVQN